MINDTILCWIFGIGMAVCMLIALIVTIYFMHQWNKIDDILENFSSINRKNPTADMKETRESRMISQLYRILENASHKENEAVADKNQVISLLSDLSHQLKTPLSNITMNTEIMENGNLDEKNMRKFCHNTRLQAEKMQWLMQNLLKASRLENGMICFEAKDIPIKATLAKAISDVYAQASKKQITILTQEFEDIPLYHNPKWTAEAMANILENAIKYSPKGSTVSVELSSFELYTQIKFRDMGPGIPQKEYNLIFQRFYRGNNVFCEEGNGLGLYLAQLILQSEKGYITVSSKPNEGSCFSMFLLNAG